MKLEVTDIQKGCTHDGPGLRTTVFLKGCPLRCRWCHNPETQQLKKETYYRPDKCIGCFGCVQICPVHAHKTQDGLHLFDPTECIRCMACSDVCPGGALEAVSQTMDLEEIVRQVLADKVFYRSRGGLTVSGGEPTAQRDGLIALLDAVKAEGIHTCLETCGYFPERLVPALAQRVDLFLYDVKDTNCDRHLENTGADLHRILHNLQLLDRSGAETILRCILIPDVNLADAHAYALAELYGSLSHCRHVELLPYHPYGLSKSQQLGRTDIRYRQPEQEELDAFAAILTGKGVPVKLHGSML